MSVHRDVEFWGCRSTAKAGMGDGCGVVFDEDAAGFSVKCWYSDIEYIYAVVVCQPDFAE